MAGRGSYNGGSTIIYVNRTFGAEVPRKKMAKSTKDDCPNGESYQAKRRKIIKSKISSIEKSLEGLKIQKANALHQKTLYNSKKNK